MPLAPPYLSESWPRLSYFRTRTPQTLNYRHLVPPVCFSYCRQSPIFFFNQSFSSVSLENVCFISDLNIVYETFRSELFDDFVQGDILLFDQSRRYSKLEIRNESVLYCVIGNCNAACLKWRHRHFSLLIHCL